MPLNSIVKREAKKLLYTSTLTGLSMAALGALAIPPYGLDGAKEGLVVGLTIPTIYKLSRRLVDFISGTEYRKEK